MADVESNIKVSIDTTEALAQLKNLQRQISAFHSSIAKTGAAGTAVSNNLSQNLANQINASGKFYAEMTRIKTTTESFNDSLQKNKFSMGEYFRYAGASTKTFGKLFKEEFNTINKVARENVKTLQTQYIKMGRDASGAVKAMSIRPLALDMNDYATKTAMAAQRQALLNQLLKQGSTNLLNFGKNTQWAGRQLMVGFTVPLLYMGTAAAKSFMQLEEQAIRFKRVYGEMFTTTDETNKALKEIELLAKGFTKYGVAVADTMKMAADAAAMGKMGADLTAQVAEATRLSVLGGVEQGKALETTISLTNAFGITADRLAGKINFLNAVENQTVTSIDDLTTAIPKAGPVIKQLGGNVEDLAFFLTAMKEGGINASEGANALKSGLAALINPSKKATEFLSGFGVNLKGIVEANKGDVKGTVVEFAKALDTLDPLNRARAIEQLFGKFQFSRLSTLFQNVTAQGTQASKVMQLANATTEELAILSERELNKVADSPMYKFKKNVEDLKVSLAPVGEQFLKAATPIVEFASKILDAFNGLGDGTKKFVTLLVAGVAGIGPILLMSFGLLANGIANIIKMFTNIKSVFNRAGQSSVVLGEQTNYLTQEQLKAASVAASLDQAHTRLQQRFTSEAQAVQLLTNAYRQGIAAQNAFMPGFGTSGKPKKYAKGVVSVPGSGTGDKVPAMLSPGEAVIPAKMASKFGGLINGMISDNIPGYRKGLPVGDIKKSLGLFKAPSAVLRQTASRGWDTLPQEVEAAINAAQEVLSKASVEVEDMNKKLGNLQRRQASHIAPDVTSMNVSGEQVDIKNWKASNLTSDLGYVNNYLNTIQTSDKIVDNFNNFHIDDAAKTLGMSVEDVAAEVQKFKKGLHPITRQSAQVLQQIALSADSLPNTKENLSAKYQSAATAAGLDVRLKGNFYETLPSRAYDPAMDASAAKTVERKVEKLRTRLLSQSQQTANMAIDATAKAAGTASPSKKTIAIGEDIASGLAVGMSRGKAKVQTAANEMSGSAIATIQQTSSQARSRRALYGNGPADAEAKSIRRQLEKRKRLEDVQSRYALRGSQVSSMAGTVGPKPVAGRLSGLMSKITPGTAMMGASGLSMVGSMMPGKVGDAMQKLIMPLMALQMIIPLVSSPLGLLAVGLGVLVGSVVSLRMAFDKAQESSMKLAESTGSGQQAMLELSKAAGNVSANEIMNRRRSGALSQFQIQTGKSSFGESFVKSDTGKSLISGINQNIKTVGNAGAQSQLLNQLATGIASGALDPAQARSIAANIAKEIGDYSFGIQVNAKLIELTGVNGENLTKDPLSLRVKLIEDNRKRAATAVNAAGKVGGFSKRAALVNTISTLGFGAITSRSTQKKLGETSGAAVSIQKIALQQEQQMLDSLDLEYEKRILAAKQAGNVLQVEKLTNEQIANRAKLLVENGKLVSDVQKSYSGSSAAVRDALMTGADKAITAQYKGTAMADVAPLAKQFIEGSKTSKDQQYVLKMQLASGQMDPMQFVNFMDTFGKDSGAITKVVDIIGKFGGAFANQMLSVAGLFVDKDGKPLVKQQTKFIADISTKSAADADKYLNLFTQISKVGQVVDVGVALSFFNSNPTAAAAIQSTIDAINSHNGKFDLKIDTKIVGAEAMSELVKNQKYFDSLPAEQQKVYMQTLTVLLGMQGDVEMQKQYKSWLQEAQNKGKSFADFAASKSYVLTQASVEASTKTSNASPTTSGVTQSSVLDSLITKMRDLRKIQIGVTEGWAASMKALKALYGVGSNGKITKDIKGFGGLEQKLRASGANQGTIDIITGLSKEDYNKYKNALFAIDKKTGKLRLKEAKILQKGLNDVAVGDFQNKQESTIKNYQNQSVALTKLMAAGFSTADAYSAIEDSTFAAAVASGDYNQKTLKGLAGVAGIASEAARNFEKLAEANNIAANIELGNYEEAASAGIDAASKYFDIQEKIIEHNYEGQIKDQENIIHKTDLAIKSAQDIQDANSYQMSRYQYEVDIIDEKASDITKKYDAQFEALDKISQINEVVAGQQQRQLGLADALSQGDISAAAKAAQEMRAANAKDSLAQQRTGMENARDAAISRLTGPGGLTKDKLEEKINNLKKANAKIDYDTIEPQKEIARQAQVQLDTINEKIKQETESLRLLGLSKGEWAFIGTKTTAAEFAAGKYDTALNGALTTLGKINTMWDTVLGKLKDYKLTKVVDPITKEEIVTVNDQTETKKTSVTSQTSNLGNGGSGSITPTPTTTSQSIAASAAALGLPTSAITPAKQTVAASAAALGLPASSLVKPTAASTAAKAATTVKASAAALGLSTKTIPASGGYGGIPYTPAKTVIVAKKSSGGMIMPAKFANGGFAVGTDTVPAMLTPGEFIVSKYGVDKFGVDNLKSINNGSYSQDSSVYNYNLSVNVKSDANPNEIARTVMAQIKQVEGQRIRGNRF